MNPFELSPMCDLWGRFKGVFRMIGKSAPEETLSHKSRRSPFRGFLFEQEYQQDHNNQEETGCNNITLNSENSAAKQFIFRIKGGFE